RDGGDVVAPLDRPELDVATGLAAGVVDRDLRLGAWQVRGGSVREVRLQGEVEQRARRGGEPATAEGRPVLPARLRGRVGVDEGAAVVGHGVVDGAVDLEHRDRL